MPVLELEYQQASRKKTEPLTSSLLAAESDLELKKMGISVFCNDIFFDPFFDKKAGISDYYFFIFTVYKNAN